MESTKDSRKLCTTLGCGNTQLFTGNFPVSWTKQNSEYKGQYEVVLLPSFDSLQAFSLYYRIFLNLAADKTFSNKKAFQLSET